MKTLSHLQTRIFDTPLAIQPAKMEVILSVLGDRIGLEIDADTLEAARNNAVATERKGYSITPEGIAVIPIQGTLMKATCGLMAMSGCTSYQSIRFQVEDAITSPQVKGVLLDIDSPGGETHGLFDLADFIYSMRGDKPIFSVSNDSAYSAAYAIASSTDKIFVTRTGGVGSIGVFCLHVDQSGKDAKEGLAYTFIKAGAKKAEGNPHEPLSDSALTDSQAEVDREYQMFVNLVARNRNASVAAITKTEAGCYFADNALPLLADQVGTYEDALAAITLKATGVRAIINMNSASKERSTMADTKELVIAATETEEVKAAAVVADEIQIKASDGSVCETCDGTGEVDGEPCPDCDESGKAEKDEPKKAAKVEVAEVAEVAESVSATASLTRIVNLCLLAGHSDLAATYINEKFTVAQVEKLLLEKRTMKSNETKVNTTIDNTTSNPTSAFDRIEQGATALAKDKGISKARAYQDLLLSNPKLYDAYLDERDTAAETRKASKEYVAAMQTKLNTRGQ